MKLKKVIISFNIILLAVSLLFFSYPSHTQAVGKGFGGLVTGLTYCTCSPDPTYWMWFFPLYFNSIPLTGPLTYTLGTAQVFSNYIIPAPGVWLLGEYLPVGNMCWMQASYFCFPLPALGMISPYVGTSL